jgi:voltage-gated potassium channel
MNAQANQPGKEHILREMFTDPAHPLFLKWQGVLNSLIFISCVSMAMETVEPFASKNSSLFFIVEAVAVAFFTLDYLANLYFAEDRTKYLFSFWGLVDLISILPSYLMILNLTALQGAKVFRLLRVVRVLRVLKMARTALQQMTSKPQISTDPNAPAPPKANPIIANLRIYLIALFSVMMISSTLMYYVEGGYYSKDALEQGQKALDTSLEANPDAKNLTEAERKFVPHDPVGGNDIPSDKQFFTSIPTAMWWCIVTLTTTGYGDMYPVTFGGRFIAGTTMLLGLVLFGILMNIVGKTLMVLLFGEQMESRPTKETVVKMLLEVELINGRHYDELTALSDEEFRARLTQER